MNKVHVAATELQQLLSQNTNTCMFAYRAYRQPHKVAVRIVQL